LKRANDLINKGISLIQREREREGERGEKEDIATFID